MERTDWEIYSDHSHMRLDDIFETVAAKVRASDFVQRSVESDKYNWARLDLAFGSENLGCSYSVVELGPGEWTRDQLLMSMMQLGFTLAREDPDRDLVAVFVTGAIPWYYDNLGTEEEVCVGRVPPEVRITGVSHQDDLIIASFFLGYDSAEDRSCLKHYADRILRGGQSVSREAIYQPFPRLDEFRGYAADIADALSIMLQNYRCERSEPKWNPPLDEWIKRLE